MVKKVSKKETSGQDTNEVAQLRGELDRLTKKVEEGENWRKKVATLTKALQENQKKLKKALSDTQKWKESLSRLSNDYRNLESRLEQEVAFHKNQQTSVLLKKLFPIFDNFYRASTHAPQVELEDIPRLTDEDLQNIANYFQGLKMIENQMEQVLGEAGLKKVPTVGYNFDPNLHEAVSYENHDEIPEGGIIAEVDAGWMFEDRVIKPAKVRVSKGLS